MLQALTMCCFAFASSNLGTLAMEHMAPIAGTAASVQGVVGTVGAAIIGFMIGQSFDGTVATVPGRQRPLRLRWLRRDRAHRAETALRPDAGGPQEQEAARESTAVPEDLA